MNFDKKDKLPSLERQASNSNMRA